ncbi:putative UDP-glucose 4-epimerase [Propionispora sp. 2/2-37]|uniref:NAD-dependent epimerase/dehydratase family protein n=1 Tax=Propionispora sp. 2/2-37 TaxID=1677858 RepID=UPI0006BB5764|nr:NAD-dependent epimerase/dehydratase family protein [Propionispora sp. 2/2-37]CUH93947.1 putative UDP-glucose 4-epimerase [Propionispora sp. 2/2-37]
MKVLVTGGAGFIGSHIVDRLLEDNIQVYILDNLSTGAMRNINPGAVFLKKDIRDRDVTELFIRERFDYVVHQAAQTTVSRSLANPYYDCDVNVLGMVNVLEASRVSGVKKIVFASSAAVYGDTAVLPLTEDCRTHPKSFYGESKLTGEKYLEKYYENFGLEYVALRYANVYGERQADSGEGGVISIFSKKLSAGEPLTVYGDGCQTRDYVYVRDVAAANYEALFKEAINCSVNISTAIETSVNELIRNMARITEQTPQAIYTAERQNDIRRSVLSNQAAGSKLGWCPNYTLAEGLSLTLKAQN